MANAPALLRLSRALHGADSLDTVLDRVREALIAHTRYDRAFIHLFAADQHSFDMVGWVLPNQDRIRQRLAAIDVSQDRLLQRGFAATEPFVIPDLRLDPDADQTQVEFFGNRTIICVPMFDGDARVGPFIVPTFADQGVLVPTDEEFEFIVQLGSLLSVVIGRLRAEDARRRLEERLALDERLGALGRMAGEIAHDFNNVLVTILANTELALSDVDAAAPRACLEDVRDAAQRASTFSRQLLAYARGQVLARVPVDLPALLHHVERLVRATLPAGAHMTCTIDPSVGVVPADAAQLERVLMNLLINARDALRTPGTVELTATTLDHSDESVGADEALRPGKFVVIAVSDDGTGIPDEVRKRIFEPYFTTKANSGTGLGLAVADGIVRQHGGVLRVETCVDVGTTFRVFLPLDDQANPPTPPISPRLPKNGRILVVDDDAQVRRTVERILAKQFEVLTAETADAALKLLRQGRFDFLITDVVLDGMDGVALAETARAEDRELGILLITGHARGKLEGLSIPHLAKPFSPNDLLRALGAALPAADTSTERVHMS